jgi:hypothetical protein
MKHESKLELVKYAVIGKYDKGDILLDSSEKNLPHVQYIIMEGSVSLITSKIAEKITLSGHSQLGGTKAPVKVQSTEVEMGEEDWDSSDSDTDSDPSSPQKGPGSPVKGPGSKPQSPKLEKSELMTEVKLGDYGKKSPLAQLSGIDSSLNDDWSNEDADRQQITRLVTNQIFSAREFGILGKDTEYKLIADHYLKVVQILSKPFEERLFDVNSFYITNLVKKVLMVQEGLQGYMNDK